MKYVRYSQLIITKQGATVLYVLLKLNRITLKRMIFMLTLSLEVRPSLHSNDTKSEILNFLDIGNSSENKRGHSHVYSLLMSGCVPIKRRIKLNLKISHGAGFKR